MSREVDLAETLDNIIEFARAHLLAEIDHDEAHRAHFRAQLEAWLKKGDEALAPFRESLDRRIQAATETIAVAGAPLALTADELLAMIGTAKAIPPLPSLAGQPAAPPEPYESPWNCECPSLPCAHFPRGTELASAYMDERARIVAARIVRAHHFAPGTTTGTRQAWLREAIACAIEGKQAPPFVEAVPPAASPPPVAAPAAPGTAPAACEGAPCPDCRDDCPSWCGHGVPCGNKSEGAMACPHCDGRKNIECETCSGGGAIWDNEDGRRKCLACRGAGSVPCERCPTAAPSHPQPDAPAKHKKAGTCPHCHRQIASAAERAAVEAPDEPRCWWPGHCNGRPMDIVVLPAAPPPVAAPAAPLPAPAVRDRPHIVNGEFQSDKYPTCPPGKVPLSVRDTTAQDLLWAYAQRRRAVDGQFADDLEWALRQAGYKPAASEGATAHPQPDATGAEGHSFCPQCGWDVSVDEDGCCAACGSTAMGDAVDAMAADHARLVEAAKELMAALDDLRWNSDERLIRANIAKAALRTALGGGQ